MSTRIAPYRLLPFLRWARGYDRPTLAAEARAGATVGVLLVPQGMAYAALAGMPPITGLYASLVALVVYAALGTSRYISVAPVAIDSLLVAAAVAPLAGGDPQRYVALAGLLAVLTGLLQIGAGVLRLGALVSFVSVPVISGFTTAAALTIAASQLGPLLGVGGGGSTSLLQTVTALGPRLGEVQAATVAVATGAVAALLLLRRYVPRVPGPLVVVALAGAAVALLPALSGVAVLGEVPGGLPAPALPALAVGDVAALLPAAGALALVSYLESISTATAFARRTRSRVDPTGELVAVGAANVAAGFFRGFSVAGGFSRGAVNVEAGARTPMSGVLAAVLIAVALLTLTPLLALIPTVALAAVIIVAVATLVDVRGAVAVARVRRGDLLALLATFAATLVLGPAAGLGVGVAVGLAMFLRQSVRPHLPERGRVPGTALRALDLDPRSPLLPVDPPSEAPHVQSTTRTSGRPAMEFTVETIETPGLGDHSYVATDGTVAVAIDPQRDVDRVLGVVDRLGVRLTHVLETHLHNDYVTGGLELADRTGADYVVAAGDEVGYARHAVSDGDVVEAGRMRLRVLGTPGHTHHHVSYVLEDADGAVDAVFTGGSMLYGATGRTDLVGPEHTDALTHAQFRSVRRLADELPADAAVYPTHGFGSFCSATPTSGDSSTVGEQRGVNPALTMAEQEYVDTLLAGLGAYPAYYAQMGPINRTGPNPVDLSAPQPVNPAELRRRLEAGDWVVDLRARTAFAAGHLAGSLGFELSTSFVTYVGWLYPYDGTPLTLIGESPEQVADAQRELVRIGIDRPAGAAVGDVSSLADGHPVRSYRVSDFAGLAAAMRDGDVQVLDARRDDERAQGYVAGSLHVPLHEVAARRAEIPQGELWVYCGSGYRAAVAASILDSPGRDPVLIDDEYDTARELGLEEHQAAPHG